MLHLFVLQKIEEQLRKNFLFTAPFFKKLKILRDCD